MQPRTLAILLIVLPLLTINGVFLISAYEGAIPWCVPYLDGCTTISRAARSGNAIFLFRVTMIVYAVLLVYFWIYVKRWLNLLHGQEVRIARAILWLGVIGALAMMVYVDFLGTEGAVNRFMRRHGILLFFTLTPLAQMLLYREHVRCRDVLGAGASVALTFQLVILLLLLTIGVGSLALDLAALKTYESENIVEWNFALLMNLYFVGMLPLWRTFRISFSR